MPKSDWAILTPIADEYLAFCSKLSEKKAVADAVRPTTLGRIGEQVVVCIQAGKGQADVAVTLQATMALWNPRWVILAGIAGGFTDKGVALGDVVIAQFVYNFDFGKTADGRFIRRPNYDYQCDVRLVSHSELISRDPKARWQHEIGERRPDRKPPDASKAVLGYIASSDKVVDDPEHELYTIARNTVGEIHAVEMEGSGAGAAVRAEQAGRAVGFLMIRGISDLPGTHRPHSSSRAKSNDAELGAAEREAWKSYAAHAAAAFTRALILEVTPALSIEFSAAVTQCEMGHVGELTVIISNPSDNITRVNFIELLTVGQWDVANPSLTATTHPIIDYLDRSLLEQTVVVNAKIGSLAKFYVGWDLAARSVETLRISLLTDHVAQHPIWAGDASLGWFLFLLEIRLRGEGGDCSYSKSILVSLNSRGAFTTFTCEVPRDVVVKTKGTLSHILSSLPNDVISPPGLIDDLRRVLKE